MQTTLNEQRVLDFLNMLEQRTTATDLEQFYHPEATQIEFPNALTQALITRNLTDLKAAAERGVHVLQKESYDVQRIFSAGDTVILECIWRGTLLIPIADIPAGGIMTAYFAQFFEFKAGKIFRQRNYDCFEPFSSGADSR